MSNLLKLPCGGAFLSDENFSIEKTDGKEYLKVKNSSWNDLTDKPFGDNEDGTVYQMSGKYVEGMGYTEVAGETETIHPIDPKFIVLTSPNGTAYNLSVSDDGTLSAVEAT